LVIYATHLSVNGSGKLKLKDNNVVNDDYGNKMWQTVYPKQQLT